MLTGAGLVKVTGMDELKPIDMFAWVNIGLFVFMCYFAYFDRFVRYRGHEYIWEFFVYAVVILVLILFAWHMARRFTVPGWLLAMTQLGILMHFAGGLAFSGDRRLYDSWIMGIRYDKYVHMFNAAVAALFVQLIPFERVLRRAWLRNLVTILLVMGMGAFVEIVEYMVMLTVETNGVGSYDNNMQDLLANLAGVSLCLLMAGSMRRGRRPGSAARLKR